MPTYEYRCGNCGVFEEFHGINQTLDKCPRCGAPVRRLISRNNNIIFKGSGFYSTDNRNGNHPIPPATDKTDNKNTTADSGKTASPTDSKAS